jgi:ribulose-5-phosphate 4-epimerase/fuculose-1-phosphate aldolase
MGLMATTPNIMKACPTRNSSDAEWQVRVDLAACYRLADMFHWTDLVYTHISARVPGIGEQFLINQFGLGFEEITASNLVRIDLDGNVVDGSEALIHKAGFIIHGAIHAVRPDAGCVIHTHSTAGIAISALADGLLPFSQHANLFYGRIGYHDHEGLAVDVDERSRLVSDLGPHPAMILRNHGLLVVGRTVPEAFSIMHHLEKACQAQLVAMGTGAKLTTPPESVCRKTAAQGFGSAGAPFGAVEWPAMLRRLERLDPSYRN